MEAELQKYIAGFVLDHDLGDDTLQELSEYIGSGDHIKYGGYTHKPVDCETFLLDVDYMNAGEFIYPEVLPHIIELNSGKYSEAVLTGGIGTAKTTVSLYTQAYQLYLLSCYLYPHRVFGLDPSSEIEIIFQNINSTLAKTVDYARFQAMISKSHYFKNFFPFDEGLKSEMVFPNRIIVKPVSGDAHATIGQNVVGGLIDEVNFMAVIEDSKQSRGAVGGEYNQALALYNSIAMRRKTRFMSGGKVNGILCLSSSRNYPGQFTDVKEEEHAKGMIEHGVSPIFVYDKRIWDIKPRDFIGEFFKVFVGDAYSNPRIIGDDEDVGTLKSDLVLDVPVEFKNDFIRDMSGAVRDIAGMSTVPKFPFISDKDAMSACLGRVRSVISREACDFSTIHIKLLRNRIKNTQYPRYVHVDLAKTGDSAGVACGYVSGFKQVDRGDNYVETMPIITYDFLLEVMPPPGKEILFFKIRKLFFVLRDMGMNIKWASYDSWQSSDSIQLLRAKGFTAGELSVDSTMIPYNILKSALSDDRVRAPMHKKVLDELQLLEFEPKKMKIDHPPHGSKDVADAMAGVAYGLTMRRENWMLHGVKVITMPHSVQEQITKADRALRRE